MLSWVVALNEGQHPRPAWQGHLQPLSCIIQPHPHPAQPAAPSRLQELIPIPSVSSGHLSFLVPCPFSLLGTLAFSTQCGSAADKGSIYTPIPTYKPSTPPSHLPYPLLHPSWKSPRFAGHPNPLRCQHRGPKSPHPLPATSPGAGGICRRTDGHRVPADGARAGGCRHHAAQNQSTALALRDGFIQRTKGLKMCQHSQPDGKALRTPSAEVLAGAPELAWKGTLQCIPLPLPAPSTP